MKRHDGRIVAERSALDGAVFRILFPVADEGNSSEAAVTIKLVSYVSYHHHTDALIRAHLI